MRFSLRLLCLALCTALFFTVPSGCSFPQQTTAIKPITAPDPYTYNEVFENYACYRLLDERLQACYGSLYTALTERFDTDEIITIHSDKEINEHIGIRIPLPQTLASKDEAQRLYDAFFRDNPQFFYISNVYSLEGYLDEAIPRYNQINLLYTMDLQKRTDALIGLESVISSIFEAAPETNDQYEMELYLHDCLAELCRYDVTAASAEYSLFPEAYTAYGALVEGRAVCEGYSRAMQLLLKKAEIECSLVTGKSAYSGESHMWNMVTINGSKYHLDVTWNDSGDRLRHNYFNMTTTQTLYSHVPDAGQHNIDSCFDLRDNYFHRNALYIDTFERQTIAAAIARQVINGNDCIQLAFSPDKFDNGQLFLKNATLTKLMVNAQLADKGLVLWDYSLLGETNEYILTIEKNKEDT